MICEECRTGLAIDPMEHSRASRCAIINHFMSCPECGEYVSEMQRRWPVTCGDVVASRRLLEEDSLDPEVNLPPLPPRGSLIRIDDGEGGCCLIVLPPEDPS